MKLNTFMVILAALAWACGGASEKMLADAGAADTGPGQDIVDPADAGEPEDTAPDSAAPDADDKSPYTVHEWGVLFNERVQGLPTHYESMDDKPILYFYSDQEIVVDASVAFSNGTGRETWPEVALGQTLSWPGLTILPTSCADDHTPFPAYGEGQCEDPWEEPCEATSLAQVVVPEAACLEFGDVTSPLLFYAGTNQEPIVPVTGDYALHPVEPAEVSVSFTPTGDFVDRFLVIYRDIETEYQDFDAAITVEAKYAWAFVEVPDEIPEGGLTLSLYPQVAVAPRGDPELDIGGVLNDLSDDFSAMLQARGLTEAEAQAFVTNWSNYLFGCWHLDGHPSIPAGVSVAVIGIHDQKDFNAWMPLILDPPPEELVRVLVSVTYL